MAIVATAPPPTLPTNLAPLPRLLAYRQSMDLARHLRRPKRGVPMLALALLWLVLAWRGSGRPEHLRHAGAASRPRLPTPLAAPS